VLSLFPFYRKKHPTAPMKIQTSILGALSFYSSERYMLCKIVTTRKSFCYPCFIFFSFHILHCNNRYYYLVGDRTKHSCYNCGYYDPFERYQPRKHLTWLSINGKLPLPPFISEVVRVLITRNIFMKYIILIGNFARKLQFLELLYHYSLF
jgi:hypothetical protein